MPFIVKLLGFEPRLAESKSDVLPLHHNSISKSERIENQLTFIGNLNYDAKLHFLVKKGK